MSCFEDLATQSRENEGKTAASEDTQDFRAQHHRAIQVLSELRAVEHHECPATGRWNALWCAKTEADEGFIVVAEAQTVVRLDELFDPFEIGRRRQLEQFLQGQGRVGDYRLVAAESDVLLDEGVEKLDRCADGGSLVWSDCKVDGDNVAAQIEKLIVGLAQKFRDAGRR